MKVNNINDLELKQHSTSVIISKRASGKTKLMLNLIKYMLDKYEFDQIILFSETGQWNEDFKWLDKKYIYKLNDDTINKIIEYQKKNLLKNKVKNVLMLLDDLKIMTLSKSLCNIFSFGRHVKVTLIMSLQFCRCILAPALRSNIDYLFISEINNNSIQTVYESISTKKIFKDIKEFESFIEDNNNDYQFIFYNNMEKDKKKRISVIKSILYNKIKLKRIKISN